MNPKPIIICGTLLVAMMAAGVSHYWSVENFIADYPVSPAIRLVPIDNNASSPAIDNRIPKHPEAGNVPDTIAAQSPSPDTPGNEFFSGLMDELRNLRNENRTLTNQIAETNRDVLKMQFQIDTHSESFRPMPTSDDRDDRSQIYDEEYPSVLPPRAQPVTPVE